MSPDAARIDLILKLSIAVAGIVVLLMVCATIVYVVSIRSDQRRSPQAHLLTSVPPGTTIRVIVAFSVVYAAFCLGILGVINSEATVSILSGVAGYVLGNISAPAVS